MSKPATAIAPMFDDPHSTRFGSFLSGLGDLIAIAPAPIWPRPYPHDSEADALRSDGLRIGDDLRTVINRERERVESAEEI